MAQHNHDVRFYDALRAEWQREKDSLDKQIVQTPDTARVGQFVPASIFRTDQSRFKYIPLQELDGYKIVGLLSADTLPPKPLVPHEYQAFYDWQNPNVLLAWKRVS